jgi:adenosylhomocysteinase
MAVRKRRIRRFLDEYTLPDGRKIYLAGEGRLVNLAAAEGHPASVMDMSFANQALGVEFIKNHVKELEKKVYPIPRHIDEEIARLKLKAMGVEIDTLTPEQEKYLHSWQLGT